MLLKRTAFGKTFFTNITFNSSKNVLLKWIRKGQIVEVSAGARSVLLSACKTDADFAAVCALPHKTDLDLAFEQMGL